MNIHFFLQFWSISEQLSLLNFGIHRPSATDRGRDPLSRCILVQMRNRLLLVEFEISWPARQNRRKSHKPDILRLELIKILKSLNARYLTVSWLHWIPGTKCKMCNPRIGNGQWSNIFRRFTSSISWIYIVREGQNVTFMDRTEP